jgi:hypothetical protein
MRTENTSGRGCLRVPCTIAAPQDCNNNNARAGHMWLKKYVAPSGKLLHAATANPANPPHPINRRNRLPQHNPQRHQCAQWHDGGSMAVTRPSLGLKRAHLTWKAVALLIGCFRLHDIVIYWEEIPSRPSALWAQQQQFTTPPAPLVPPPPSHSVPPRPRHPHLGSWCTRTAPS